MFSLIHEPTNIPIFFAKYYDYQIFKWHLLKNEQRFCQTFEDSWIRNAMPWTPQWTNNKSQTNISNLTWMPFKKKRLRITFMKIQAVNAKVKSYKKMFHFWKSKLWMLRSTHILHRCFCIWWLSDNLSLFKLDWVTHKCNIWYLDVIFTWNLVSNGIFLDLFRSMPYY